MNVVEILVSRRWRLMMVVVNTVNAVINLLAATTSITTPESVSLIFAIWGLGLVLFYLIGLFVEKGNKKPDVLVFELNNTLKFNIKVYRTYEKKRYRYEVRNNEGAGFFRMGYTWTLGAAVVEGQNLTVVHACPETRRDAILRSC